jgi:uncharacterized membrane protein required for colicin V production
MWLEWIALTVLIVFGALGAWRGTLATFLRIFGLGLAYAVGLLAAPRLGPFAAAALGVPALLGTAVAGAGAFGATLALMGPVSWLLRRREQRRRGDEPRSGLDRAGGALFGLAQGAVIALLIGLLGNWLGVLRNEASGEAKPAAPSPLAEATSTVIERAADLALDEDASGARLAVRLATRPAQTLDSVRVLMERPELKKLRDDELFWSYVENGAVEQAMNRGSLLSVSFDRDTRAELASLGVVGKESAADPNAFRAELRPVLEQIGPRIRALKQSGELQRLLEDPEIFAAVQSGDSVTLLAHPSFRSLVYRVLESTAQSPVPAAHED